VEFCLLLPFFSVKVWRIQLAIGVTEEITGPYAVSSRRLNIRYYFIMDLRHPAISEAKSSSPSLIATSVVPVNSFIGGQLQHLPENHVASLAYAFSLYFIQLLPCLFIVS
jgi:hypothetical protein